MKSGSRIAYLSFTILSALMLMVAFWFMVYYSTSPLWVWTLFGVGLFFQILSAVITELYVRVPESCGQVKGKSTSAIIAGLFGIVSFILIVTGIILLLINSNLPYWVIIVLGLYVLFQIMAVVLAMFFSTLISAIFMILALATGIAAIILIIIYANSPWWVWLLFGIAFLLSALAGIFNVMGNRGSVDAECVVQEQCLVQQIPVQQPILLEQQIPQVPIQQVPLQPIPIQPIPVQQVPIQPPNSASEQIIKADIIIPNQNKVFTTNIVLPA